MRYEGPMSLSGMRKFVMDDKPSSIELSPDTYAWYKQELEDAVDNNGNPLGDPLLFRGLPVTQYES